MWTLSCEILAGLALVACASSTESIDRQLREVRELRELPAPPPASGENNEAFDPAQPVTAPQLIALATERSPRLRADARALRVLLYQARAATALPPPELTAAIWNSPLSEPWALGKADMLMLEARQTWPAPGGRDARAGAIVAEAHARAAALVEERLALGLRVSEAFAAYVRAVRGGDVNRQQQELLDRMAAVVRARLATGGSSLADATRIDLERARVGADSARLEAAAEGARARLNALLGRSPDAALGPPAETVALKTAPPAVLMQRAKSARGTILAAKARVQAAERERDAADAEAGWPEMTLGLGYWQDPSERPGIGLSFGITLPWLSGAGRDRLHAAEAQVEAARAEVDASEYEVALDVSDALAEVALAERSLASLKKGALPPAERSVQALAASYSTGAASLLEWIEAARTVLQIRAQLTELDAELAVAVARLDLAVGGSSQEVQP